MRIVDSGEHHARANGPDRFGEALVLVGGEHTGEQAALLVLQQRQDAKHRNIQAVLQLLSALDGIVQGVQQQGQCNSQAQGNRGCDGDNQRLPRLDRGGRHNSRIHNPGVASFQIGSGCCFLQAGQEGVVERAVGIDLALQLTQLELLA
ncbi:hypothetical protein D9M70_420270 [compost metagenome]